MSAKRPTTRETFDSEIRGESDQNLIERAYFDRVLLPNGTYKTTWVNRLSDVNETLGARLLPANGVTLRVIDVAISSGIGTLELYRYLTGLGFHVQMVGTDLMIQASLLSLGSSLEALIDKYRNILHFDILGQGIAPSGPGLKGLVPSLLRRIFRVAMRIDKHLSPLQGKIREHASGIVLKCRPYSLLTRKLVGNNDIVIEEDDLQDSHSRKYAGAFDVVRAANVLNLGYFQDCEIVNMASSLRSRLRTNGLLVVCRTHPDGVNHGTVFRLNPSSGLQVESRIGNGSEVERLVLEG
jgi:hypothetical protein